MHPDPPSTPKCIENAQVFYGCLHFRYNGKKYLYGISEELLTCGEETGFLSKLNGTYQPSEREKKEKSSLLLKKQKSVLKLDYIIIPRKACEHQYLWHFQRLSQKLACRHFLMLPLPQEEKRTKEPVYEFQTKRRIMMAMVQGEGEGKGGILGGSGLGCKVEGFCEHENVMRKVEQGSKTNNANSTNNINNNKNNPSNIPLSPLPRFNTFQSYDSYGMSQQPQDPTIQPLYQHTLTHLTLHLTHKSTLYFISTSSFHHISPSTFLPPLQHCLNTIRQNSSLPLSFQLTEAQLSIHKEQLSKEITRIGGSQEVFFPTHRHQLRMVFLPDTSMITMVHKHHIVLVNPGNLAARRLQWLGLGGGKVRGIVLTRFSMAFVEFVVGRQGGKEWGIKANNAGVLEVVTVKGVYQQVKSKLRQVFMWTDQMVRQRVVFRVIPQSAQHNGKLQNKNSNLTSNITQPQQPQSLTSPTSFPLSFLQISHHPTPTLQTYWQFKFGNKTIIHTDQLITPSLFLSLSSTSQYITFDHLSPLTKQQLYQMSSTHPSIKQKFIYNRGSKAKYGNKFLRGVEEKEPMVRVVSGVRVGEEIVGEGEGARYQRVRLECGESVNCVERNVVLLEGLVMVVGQQQAVGNEDGVGSNRDNKQQLSSKSSSQYPSQTTPSTTLHLCWPITPTHQNGQFCDLKHNKIRNVKELISLKQSVLLIEQREDEEFYENLLGKRGVMEGKEDKWEEGVDRGVDRPFGMVPGEMEVSQQLLVLCSTNSLLTLLPRHLNTLTSTHTPSIPSPNNQPLSSHPTSPFTLFLSLFKKTTLQSGQVINHDNSKVYLVIKGSLKWGHGGENGPKAGNNAFMGNVRGFYWEIMRKEREENEGRKRGKLGGSERKGSVGYGYGCLEDNINSQMEVSPIQVIKDTWALEASLEELHEMFFTKYPEVAYFIIEKGNIFY